MTIVMTPPLSVVLLAFWPFLLLPKFCPQGLASSADPSHWTEKRATTTESPFFSSLAINLLINFSNAIIGAGNPNHKKRRKQLLEGGREVIA